MRLGSMILLGSREFELINLLRFHFHSLAHDNCAVLAAVDDVTVILNDRHASRTPSASVLIGSQAVPKFNLSTPDQVQILMALFRVDWKNVDLVVTFNVPILTSDGDRMTQKEVADARADFDAFVRDLEIIDYGLFQ